jgi:hypothetical protein
MWADTFLVNTQGFSYGLRSRRVEVEAHVFLCLVGNRVPPYNHLFAGFEKAFVLKVEKTEKSYQLFPSFQKGIINHVCSFARI